MILRLSVAAPDVEAVTDLLWQLGTTGVAEVDGPDGRVELTAGFADVDADGPDPRVELARHGVLAESVEPVDWVRQWAEHAGAVEVAGLTIAPPWDGRATDPGVIVIDPGESFGHGGHPTTRLVLELLVATVRPGDRVLDVGSGSGVLAIAAARSGARTTAIDIDPEARRVTAANAAANGLGPDAVRVLDDDLSTLHGTFDLVLANVTVDVQELLAHHLDRLAGSGPLILSGVLTDQVPRVAAAHPRRTIGRRIDLDGWSGLVLRRS